MHSRLYLTLFKNFQWISISFHINWSFYHDTQALSWSKSFTPDFISYYPSFALSASHTGSLAVLKHQKYLCPWIFTFVFSLLEMLNFQIYLWPAPSHPLDYLKAFLGPPNLKFYSPTLILHMLLWRHPLHWFIISNGANKFWRSLLKERTWCEISFESILKSKLWNFIILHLVWGLIQDKWSLTSYYLVGVYWL